MRQQKYNTRILNKLLSTSLARKMDFSCMIMSKGKVISAFFALRALDHILDIKITKLEA
jgi:hypothetical protein